MSKELVFSARRKDFRVDTFRTGGPGGQHQNKTDSGVRITHIESGLSAESREHKSQHQNKAEAFKKLVPKLINHYVPKVDHSHWRNDETIRTYHAEDNRVKDKASGKQMEYREIVDKNNLAPMIEARRLALVKK